MFPKKTIGLIIWVTNAAWFCGTIPFRFQPDSASGGMKMITPTFTKWRAAYVKTTFAINFFYITFIAIRLLLKVYLHNDKSLEQAIQLGYQFFAFTMIVVIQVNTLYMWEEEPRFFKRYFAHFRYFKDRYGFPGESGPKCLKFFYAWFIIGTLVNIQNIILLFKKPSRAHYVTSVFENPEKTPISTRFPFMIFQFAVWTTSWTQVWALCFHLYAYFCGLVWAVREIDIGVKEPKTRSTLRQSRTFYLELRSLHVLHRLWLHSHQTWFCPSHKFVAVCVATLGLYGVIRLSGLPSYTMGCMATITLVYVWTLFSKFGQLHDISRDMLWNWKTHPQSTKWMRKFVRSVPVFSVDVGSFYRVKRMTVFTALLTVLNNTVTILLV